MVDIGQLLARVAEITKKRMAVVTNNGSLVSPEGTELFITCEEAARNAGKNCRGWNIYSCGGAGAEFFLCIAADSYYENEATGLAILLMDAAAAGESAPEAYMRKAIEGVYDAAELAGLEENLKDLFPGYLLLIDNFGDYRAEVLEILINTMNVKISFLHDNRIMALAEEENIYEAGSSFIKNVLSELFIECVIAIGGRAEAARELHELYENCREALCLRNIYKLGDSVLSYESMYGYRIAYNLDPKLKGFIKRRVFTEEFSEAAGGELGSTIEEFFRNNLNLTDTAAKLYIHRNTLLYRLDKIHKYTGFDLKRFEDSWLFRLAWIIHKERQE